jgi:DNA-binding response OmpR family regulator
VPVSRSILIVEDDAALRAMLAEQLTSDGSFVPVEAESAAEAEAKLGCADADFHAVLLDIGLPDGDGRDLCAKLRRNGKNLPIIMLTGADGEKDIVSGFDAGASDYLPKPFSMAELLARVRAQLRAFENTADASFDIGPYAFRPSAKLLRDRASGRKVRLTDKETSLLRVLYRAEGRPVSRQVLLDEVWGYQSGVTTHTLETHIYRVRQKIEAYPPSPVLLRTTTTGYLLDA